MDYIKLNEVLNLEIDNMKKDEVFIEFIKLKSLINSKYKNELNLYLSSKKEYEKALEFGEYYPNYKSIKSNYALCKSNLFSLNEVKLYFNYLHLLEDKYNLVLDEIKKEILD